MFAERRSLVAFIQCFARPSAKIGEAPSFEDFVLPERIPVYNLTTERHHCYYANGFLVSNSDSFGYIAEAEMAGMIHDNGRLGGKSATTIKVTYGGPRETDDDFDDAQPRVSYGGNHNRKVRVRK